MSAINPFRDLNYACWQFSCHRGKPLLYGPHQLIIFWTAMHVPALLESCSCFIHHYLLLSLCQKSFLYVCDLHYILVVLLCFVSFLGPVKYWSCLFWFVLSFSPKVRKYCVCVHSCPALCDPMAVACQAPLSVKFSRQESWSELPFPPPGDLPTRDWTRVSCVSCIGRRIFTTVPPGKPIEVNLQTSDAQSLQEQFKVYTCEMSTPNRIRILLEPKIVPLDPFPINLYHLLPRLTSVMIYACLELLWPILKLYLRK